MPISPTLLLSFLLAAGGLAVAAESGETPGRYHQVEYRSGRSVVAFLIEATDRELTLALGPRIQHVPRDRVRSLQVIEVGIPRELPPLIRDEIESALAEAHAAPSGDQAAARRGLERLGARCTPYLALMLMRRDLRRSEDLDPLSWMVARRGGRQAIESLGALLRSPVEAERLVAVRGFDAMKAAMALPLLLVAVGDESPRVSRVARRAAAALARELPTLDVLREIKKQVGRARGATHHASLLGEIGTDEAIGVLRSLLFRGPEARTISILGALGPHATLQDGQKVLRQFKRASVSLKKEACLFFGRARCFAAIPLLIASLTHEDEGVARNAHWALRHLSGLKLKAEPRLWKGWWLRSRDRLEKEAGRP